MTALLVLLLACTPAPTTRGVYRSGEGKGDNAVLQGTREGPQKLWGPSLGTVERTPTPAPGGHTFVGQPGVLWKVERDIPAVPKPFAVDAALVESAGFKLREVLGTASSGAKDAARAGGVYVRSMVKIRRPSAPPVYLVTATGDTVGAGRLGGPSDVRDGENCKAVVAMFDAKVERILASQALTDATATCAVPVLAAPVDLDGDGVQHALVHGQLARKGFRSWFTLRGDSLVAGASERWEDVP